GGLIGIVFAVAAAYTPPSPGEPAPANKAVVVGVASLVAVTGISLFLLLFWAWGRAVRRRRERAARWERDVLDAIAARAAEAVRGERHQVAIGLRSEVIAHTARLVSEAEQPGGSLVEIAAEGRAALAGMRKLLDVLDEEK
ncbi:hypothetical protein, partial [Actinocorallia lasiicapitis]